MNQLTKRLLAEGYTPENHPDYVEWTYWKHFEYTAAYLRSMVWETPCGLLKKGMDYNHGSHMGVDYCPENDNPRLGCPYYDEKPCRYRHDTKLLGWNCTYRQTDRLYDYEQSVEKLWDEWDRIKHEARLEATKDGICNRLEWDRPKRKYVIGRDVVDCLRCQNEVCIVSKQPRNLEKVNIFYDILREKHYRIGLADNTERSLEKGVKVFKAPVTRAGAEMWLKLNKDTIFRPQRDDYRNLHFSEHHGKTGFGEYDFFEFKISVQNVRIERRESRDLIQDLRDVRDGLTVVHASDVAKAAAQAKKEKRDKYRQPQEVLKRMARRVDKETMARIKQLWQGGADAEEIAEELGLSERYAGKVLAVLDVAPVAAPRVIRETEQLSLF
jgi:hypothetical protein